MTRSALLVFGTRPEAIKMAPVYQALQRSPLTPRVCVTAQHRTMLDQVLAFFEITPDIDLGLMRHDQAPHEVLGAALDALMPVIHREKPAVILVQGDTTTTLAGALAGFYSHTPVGHVEAGLRTYDRYSPFPEEINRQLTSRVTDLHFAPTERARRALLAEGLDGNGIFVTGNTVVDGFRWAAERLGALAEGAMSSTDPAGAIATGLLPACFRDVDWSRRIILVTAHRRESFGEPFEQLCTAIRDLARAYPDTLIIYPVHLNPRVREPVFRILEGARNVLLWEPLDYPALVWVMAHSYLVLTDSGGIQEEAPSLVIPVLVMRDTTERPEGVEAGVARLVGTSHERITAEAAHLLDDPAARAAVGRIENPYGDGLAGARIRDILVERFAA